MKLYETMVKDVYNSYTSKETNFEKLDVNKLYKSIENSDHCLYIFDYDMMVPDGNTVSPLFEKVLELEQKSYSLIIVVCEKTKEECIKMLPELEKTRIIVIAEHGLWVKLTHEWINTNSRHEKNI